MDVVSALREQGEGCRRLGSPMYAELLERAADDVVAGGPVAHVLAGHEDDDGPSALALRLVGSVHRLVLQRRAGALAAYFPSVGGSWEPEAGWDAWRAVVTEQPDAVREWLDRAPQTNETGRAAALTAGLLELGRTDGRPVRVLELGASAGLNLLADRFRYSHAEGERGESDSPVHLTDAWRGPGPWDAPWPRVVERHGCDLRPIEATSTEGRLALTAYVWPDQVHRHERLRGALALAARHPIEVRRQGAADAVESLGLRAGTVTVVWHSIVWQYLDRVEQTRARAALARLGAGSGAEAGFAHLFLEPTRRAPGAEHELLLVLERPGHDRQVLASAPGHGVPVTWEAGLTAPPVG